MSSAALVAEPFFLNDMGTTRRIKTSYLLWCFCNTNATAEKSQACRQTDTQIP